jgi:hypothetical protein
MKSSRAISLVRCLHWTDVSRTISVIVIIIRDLMMTMMMIAKVVLETSVQCRHLTRLTAREDFVEFSRRESSRTKILLLLPWHRCYSVEMHLNSKCLGTLVEKQWVRPRIMSSNRWLSPYVLITLLLRESNKSVSVLFHGEAAIWWGAALILYILLTLAFLNPEILAIRGDPAGMWSQLSVADNCHRHGNWKNR